MSSASIAARRIGPSVATGVISTYVTSPIMRVLRLYWGWAVLAPVIGAVVNGWLGPPAVLFLSSLCLFYFLFQAPTWCMVKNRDGTLCRHNAKGIFLGCHLRQHK
jgi:hypothetical protein